MTPRPEPTIHLGTMSNGVPLRVPLHMFETHCQILGPTGYGKSRLSARLIQELVAKTPDATIVLDPAGDLSNHLRRWAYQRGLQHRMMVINPRERRRVCGLNPIRPWPDRHGQQAGVLRDIIRRSLGANENSGNTPLASQWIFNVIFALLASGLTMFELTGLLSPSDSRFRDAVVDRMPNSMAKDDFLGLAEALRVSSASQRMRLMFDQLGSTCRRLRQFATNEYLMHMLAARVNAVDWGWVIDRGMLVLVNLSLEGNVLTDEDQRLLGQLVVSSIIRESFARPERRRKPVNLLIDEAGKLASPEVTTVLNEGRKFLVRLILAHQTLSQLVDHHDNDTTLLDAVVNNARLKIVFGGLGSRDACEMGATLYGHLGDPDKRKLELRTPMQLSRVVPCITKTSSVGEARGLSRSHSWSEMYGTSDAEGSSSMSGSSSGDGQGWSRSLAFSSPADPAGTVGGMSTECSGDFSGSSEGEFEGCSTSDVHAEHHAETEGESRSVSRVRSLQRSLSRGLMVVPGEPFEQLTAVQFEPLEEQLHRHMSRMIRQPDRHAMIAYGKLQPADFRVVDVPEPTVTEDQARIFDLRVMRRLPCYAEPQAIEREIAERHRALLAPAAVDTVDSESAIRRRRAERVLDGPASVSQTLQRRLSA